MKITKTLMQKVNHNLYEAIKLFKDERGYNRLSIGRKFELQEEILKDPHYKENGIHIEYKLDNGEKGFFGII